MTTVAEIINPAARKIGIERLTAKETRDAIEALNLLIKQWTAQNLLVNAVTRESFTLVAATASYLVGSGQTFNTTWPTSIKAAFINHSGTDYPLALFSAEEYAYTTDKTTAQQPRALYYERTYPYGRFFFWPTPDQGYTFNLWSYKNFGSYDDITDTINLPAEYEPALIWNLAIELCDEFGRNPTQVMAAKAQMGLKIIKNMNIQPVPQINTDVICRRASWNEEFAGWDYNRFFPYTFPFVVR